MTEARIGVIGGTGLYAMEGLEIDEEQHLETPFGQPSDPYLLGRLDGVPVAFLARHGRGHRWLPSEINFRANLFGFKLLGVERMISVSAVGAMKIEYQPCHVVIPDQFIDRTRQRPGTFFGGGLAGHVSLADPTCPELLPLFAAAAEEAGATVHRGGTYLCMEGPQFSTRAESLVYRQWGVDVIGMTNLPEAKLAREAEICYGTLAMVTDYDCWHESLEAVSAEAVMAVVRQNVATAQRIVRRVVARLATAPARACSCGEALRHALITDLEQVPSATLERLRPIIGKYLGNGDAPEGRGSTS